MTSTRITASTIRDLGLILSLIVLPNCSLYPQEVTTSCQNPVVNAPFSKSAEVTASLEKIARSGVPGVSLAVYTAEGWWTASAGYARLEDQQPMEPCHLQYLQSVSKTYMAVSILKLHEDGKIKLDDPFTRYVPPRISRYITDATKITVRMLLNHTSGIPEYNMEPNYVAYLLQHPTYRFTPEEYLQYIDGKPLDFPPGSRYSYRNTNYVLLALLADAVAGDHAKLISEVILKPLGLKQTYYRDDPAYLSYPTLVNSYWDRYSNGIVEDATTLQRTNVASLVGDDGLVTTPYEAVLFLRGLVEGKLLTTATLAEMRTWVNDRQGEPTYGLGLDLTTMNGFVAYGHSGGGIGAGCELYYFPEKGLYSFVAINLGTVTDSPLHREAGKAREALYDALLK